MDIHMTAIETVGNTTITSWSPRVVVYVTKSLEEKRADEVRKRYPPGPWPFQAARERRGRGR